jgi:hypothetical protein
VELTANQKYLRDEAMAKHKAEMIQINPPTPQFYNLIVWKNPDHGTYRMDFVLYRNCLFVTGDCECAVYRWSQEITWDFLARCDYGYFFGKCDASSTGSRPTEWDSDKADKRIEALFKEYVDDNFTPDSEDEHGLEVFSKKDQAKLNTLYEAKRTLFGSNSSDELISTIGNLDEKIREDVLGSDYYMDFCNIGDVSSLQTWIHWQGLQLALTQLGIK